MLKKIGAIWTIIIATISFISLLGLVYELIFVSTKRKIDKTVDADRIMDIRAKQLKRRASQK